MKFDIPAGRALRRLLLLTGVIALGACNDDPSAPVDTGGDVTGTWTAVNLSGNPLPISEAYVDPERGACLRKLESLQLSFLVTGAFTWYEVGTLECAGGAAEDVSVNFDGTYEVQNTRLIMSDPDEPEGEINTGFSVDGNTLTLRQNLEGLIITSVFTRAN